jgi:hypothetical protein
MSDVVNAIHQSSKYSYQSWWMACAEFRIVCVKHREWPSQSLWMLHQTWWVASAELTSVRGFYMYLCISEVFRRTNYSVKFIYILRLFSSGMWHCIEPLDSFCQYAATCLWTLWHNMPEVDSHAHQNPKLCVVLTADVSIIVTLCTFYCMYSTLTYWHMQYNSQCKKRC